MSTFNYGRLAGAILFVLSTPAAATCYSASGTPVAPVYDSNMFCLALSDGANADGNYATAIGYNSTATAEGALGLGTNAYASGLYATALGGNSVANGQNSTALGGGSVSGDYALGLGYQASASGNSSIAVGYGAYAAALNGVAIGTSSNAGNASAVALGNTANATSDSGIAVGSGAKAGASQATAVGSFSLAKGIASLALGQGASANSDYSVSAGYGATATGTSAVVVGQCASSTANNTVVLGKSAQATFDNGIAIGNGAAATALYTTAVGDGAVASAPIATVFGRNAKAVSGLAVGANASASGAKAVSAGNNSSAYGNNAVAVGDGSKAAQGSTAIGQNAFVYANYSEAIGQNAYVGDTTMTNSTALGSGAWVSKGPLASYSAFLVGTSKSNGTVSVGNGALSSYRIIENVAGGRDDHDVVNVAQLKAAKTLIDANTAAIQALRPAAQLAFDSTVATTATASGAGAAAVGAGASSTGAGAIAVGRMASVTKDGAVAVGDQSSVTTTYGVGIGAASQVVGSGGVAIGYLATVDAAATNGVAIGGGSRVSQGPQSNYSAFGLAGTWNSAGAVSFGAAGSERVLMNVAPGVLDTDGANIAQLKATRAIVDSNASAMSGLIATGARIAIDTTYTDGAQVGGKGAIALGSEAAATANYAVAMGLDAEAKGAQAVALGSGAWAYGDGATALGANAGGADTPYSNATSVGSSANAEAASATAIGSGAHVTKDHSVALGDGVTASRGAQTYNGFLMTGQQSAGEVAVGNTGSYRQITGVAAGSEDNDAVNVAQLRTLDTRVTTLEAAPGGATLPVAIAVPGVSAASASAEGVALGSNAAAQGTQAVAIGYGANAVNVKSIALGAGSVTTENLQVSVGDSSTGLTRKIANVKDGTSSSDAATVGQLQAVGGTASAADSKAVSAKSAADAAALAASSATASINALAQSAVSYADGNKTVLSLGDGATPVRISQVADGTLATDAATVGQVMSVQATASNAVSAANVAQTSTDLLSSAAVKYSDALHNTVALGDGSVPVRISQVADGVVATDAATVGQVSTANSNALAAQNTAAAAQGSADLLAASVVVYSDADHKQLALGNGTDRVRISQLADGVAASDAATVGQVADARSVGSNAQQAADAASALATTANSGVAALGQSAVQYQDSSKAAVSFSDGSQNVRLQRVADGVTASDAVNKGQLDAVAGLVGSGTALGVGYVDSTRASVVLAGTSGTTISNLADGVSEHDAATVGQLQVVDTRLSGALDDVRSSGQGTAAAVAALGATAVQYGSGGRTTVTLGDAGSPVLLHNVADGVSATDAVSKGQLDRAVGSNAASPLAMSYDDGAFGNVTLKGSAGTRVSNLADGVDDHDASSVGQLHAVDTRLSGSIDDVRSTGQATAAAVSALSAASVGYDAGGRTRVTFGDTGTPVTLSNVAAGSAPTDAVNRSQLDAVAAEASTGTPLGVAYTDSSRAAIALGGASGSTIHNVAAGTLDSDAANVGQVGAVRSAIETVAVSLGGGAGFGFDGAFIAPAYKLQGQIYRTVGDAFAAVDGGLDRNAASVTSLDNRLTSSLDGLSGSSGANNDALRALSARVDQLEKSPGGGTGSGGGVAVGGMDGGQASVVDNTNGVAVGGKASAGGQNATAIGGNSFAAGAGDTAIGGGATVSADYSTAVGSNTRVAAIANHSVALGANASVAKDHSVAVGESANALGQNAVALGAGSVADRDNSVSVGAAGQERAITNVAAGTQATDAANTAQVEAGTQRAIDTARTYTDQRFVDLQTGMDQFARGVDDRFRAVDRRMNGTGAMSTAMSQMGTAAGGASGNGRLAAGIGYQGGEHAIAVGYATAVGDRVHINFGGAATATQTTVGAGIGVDL
jgi:autotransporter adhesin